LTRPPKSDVDRRAAAVVARLERMGSKAERDGLSRFGIVAKRAFGVPMREMLALAKELGRDHELALALWKSGIYEARTVAALIDDPARVTPAQMEAWCRDFDNWGICDTVCFKLFDRSPHARTMVARWSGRRAEFEKRAAFALLASLGGHDRTSGDEPYLRLLPLVERAAEDDRNFVKKGVSWALRSVGRRSSALQRESIALAKRLAASASPAARWIGRDALRDFSRAVEAAKARKAAKSGRRAQ
jgi:3-methyladenine DNA glycosylase AlkD